jgi:hypothetical protein
MPGTLLFKINFKIFLISFFCEIHLKIKFSGIIYQIYIRIHLLKTYCYIKNFEVFQEIKIGDIYKNYIHSILVHIVPVLAHIKKLFDVITNFSVRNQSIRVLVADKYPV